MKANHRGSIRIVCQKWQRHNVSSYIFTYDKMIGNSIVRIVRRAYSIVFCSILFESVMYGMYTHIVQTTQLFNAFRKWTKGSNICMYIVYGMIGNRYEYQFIALISSEAKEKWFAWIHMHALRENSFQYNVLECVSCAKTTNVLIEKEIFMFSFISIIIQWP